MSPITRVVHSTRLNQSERIDIVRQNGDHEVILSIIEERTNVQDRKTIRLTIRQAMKLSRDLAGISVQPGTDDDVD